MAIALDDSELEQNTLSLFKEEIKKLFEKYSDYKKKQKTWNFPYNQKNHRVICFLNYDVSTQIMITLENNPLKWILAIRILSSCEIFSQANILYRLLVL